MDEIIIREEVESDWEEVDLVIRRAFETVEISDKTEHLLVRRLRGSTSFIPELSLVATYQEAIVGHILLTPIKIINDSEAFDSLALAPVTVEPQFQSRGIGGKLILEGHARAIDQGFQSVVLIGHADYYPRFGYKKARELGISFPFELPDENALAIELIPQGLEGISGVVTYPKEFFE